MGFAPLALACGHLVQGPALFHAPSADDLAAGAVVTVECPEGCGMQAYVVEPPLDTTLAED